jgi:hypothetical protein
MDYTMCEYGEVKEKMEKFKGGKMKKIEKMMANVVYRKMGKKLIRISTPLHKVRIQDIPSPSE